MKIAVWIGRVISFLVVAMFSFSAIMKFVGGPDLEEGLEKMQIPMTLITTIAILEILSVVFYAIPQTTIIGAILLTGYLGGAIMTHLRVGDPVVVHVVLGVFIWLGIFLREPRLRSLIPIRLPATQENTSPSD